MFEGFIFGFAITTALICLTVIVINCLLDDIK